TLRRQVLRDAGERRRRGAGPEPDDRAGDLARDRVGKPHDRRLGDRGMRGEQVLELARADVLALPDDDVLPPPGDAEIARGVDRPEVAGAKPAVGREGL